MYLYGIRTKLYGGDIMDIEKVTELVDEAKSIVVMLENDLYMQKQDMTTIYIVKTIHHLLKEAREIIK